MCQQMVGEGGGVGGRRAVDTVNGNSFYKIKHESLIKAEISAQHETFHHVVRKWHVVRAAINTQQPT